MSWNSEKKPSFSVFYFLLILSFPEVEYVFVALHKPLPWVRKLETYSLSQQIFDH